MRVTAAGQSFKTPVGVAPPVLHDPGAETFSIFCEKMVVCYIGIMLENR